MLCFLAATRREQKEAAKGTHGLFAGENGPKLSDYDQVDLLRRILKSNNFPPLVHDCQVPTYLLHKFEGKNTRIFQSSSSGAQFVPCKLKVNE